MIAGSKSACASAREGKGKRQLRKMAQMENKANEDADVEMNGNGNGALDDEKHEEEDEDDEEEHGDKGLHANAGAWISSLAASDDGQWLVSSDTNARVTIYNLDTLQVSPRRA